MKKFAFAVAAVALAASAQAATIATMGPALTSFGDTLGLSPNPGPALTGSLDMFDSTLGTLTGATLKLSTNMTTTITAVATTAANFRTSMSVDMGFDSSIGAVDSLLSPLFMFNLSGGPGGVQTLAANATTTYGPFNDSGTMDIDLASALSAIQAAGGGSFDVSCNALGSLVNTFIGGNVGLTQQTNAGCGAEIVYTYTVAPPPAVPEPGSMALVGLALAGLGLSARRRAAK